MADFGAGRKSLKKITKFFVATAIFASAKCQSVKELKAVMEIGSPILGLSHNHYNSEIYVLTNQGIFNHPYLDDSLEMNYSEGFSGIIPGKKIIYSPNTTQITQVRSFCFFWNRLVVFGDTGRQAPENKAVEIQMFKQDSSLEIASILNRIYVSSDHVMQECNSNYGAIFRSLELEEKVVHYNQRKGRLYIMDEPVSSTKFLSAISVHSNFVMSIISKPGEFCALIQAAPPSFWQQLPGSQFFET